MCAAPKANAALAHGCGEGNRRSRVQSAMAPHPSDWRSFWDLATPEEGASAIIEIYGAGAAEAVLGCVAAAQHDDREEDCRFWTAVLECVEAADTTSDNADARH
jgi:hypothetical protein